MGAWYRDRTPFARCLGLGCKVWGNADPLTESQLNSGREWFGNAGTETGELGGMLVEDGGCGDGTVADGLTHCCKRPETVTRTRRSTLMF